MAEKIWRVREVAEQLGVTVETVLKRLHEGKLKGFRVGRAWRITDAAFTEFKERSPELRRAPFADFDAIISPAGECTRDSEKDQLRRESREKEWTSPEIPE